jgi:hypothetical protein
MFIIHYSLFLLSTYALRPLASDISSAFRALSLPIIESRGSAARDRSSLQQEEEPG